MTDDLVKRLNMVDATMNPMTLVIVVREAAKCIEEMQRAIVEWQFAIVDWEGVDFVDRIEDKKSREIIENVLEAYVKNDNP